MGIGGNSSEVHPQSKLKNAPDYIPFEDIEIISEQKKNNVFKIMKKNDIFGTGFLCLIPFPDKLNLIPVLFTCNHVLNQDDISPGNEIKLLFNDKIEKIITIEETRKTWTNKDYDITMIEIKRTDGFFINDMLEVDDYIYKDVDLAKIYKDKTVYLIHYPLGLKSSYSCNIIKNIDINNIKIEHLCATEDGSSGAPILNLKTFKVIGIHTGKHKTKNVNIGTIIREAINEFNKFRIEVQRKNEIIMTLYIPKEDLYKEIFFLNNTAVHFEDNLKELNGKNIRIYINNVEQNFRKYFVPKEEGIYTIKIIFNIILKNCRCLFKDCKNITSINLTCFDTENVTKMSYMFSGCEKLIEINFSNFKTSNVTDISRMFQGCLELKDVDLSHFDTQKVTYMGGMFANCHNLKEIDFSSFNTKNVKSLKSMFFECIGLSYIDLSQFDTKNVEDMSGMFEYCRNIKSVNLSSFNTENVKFMYHMFRCCDNLLSVDLSNFNTKNVITFRLMFNLCESLQYVDLSSFESNNATSIYGMFCFCKNLFSINLASFDFSTVKEVSDLLCGCSNLIKIIVNQKSYDIIRKSLFWAPYTFAKIEVI